MATELTCPECGEPGLSANGLHGHARFVHDLEPEEAGDLVERAKAEAAGVATRGPASGDGQADREGETAFGEVSDHVRQRLAESADVAASMRMLEALDREGVDGDRSRAEDLAELADVLETLEDLRGDGSESIGLEDVREVVREEAAEHSPDGPPVEDWRAVALTHDVDPEQVEAVAEATGANIGSSLERIVDKLIEAGPEDAAGWVGVGQKLYEGFAGQRRESRPRRERRPPDRRREASAEGEDVRRRRESSGQRALERVKERSEDAEEGEAVEAAGGAE